MSGYCIPRRVYSHTFFFYIRFALAFQRMLVTYIENKYRIGKLLTIKANYGFNNNNKLQLLKLLKEQEEEREKK